MRHFIPETRVEQINHRSRRAAGRRRRMRKSVGGRINVRRKHISHRAFRRRLGRRQRAVGRLGDFAIRFGLERIERRRGENPLGDQKVGERLERITIRFRRTLRSRAIESLVVGKRMRVRTNHFCVHERRPETLARIGDRLRHHRVTRQRIRAVHRQRQQIGKALHNFRNAASGGLHLDRNGNRVAVVFDQKHNRQLKIARRIERFKKFTLARRAVSGGNVGHFIRLKASFHRAFAQVQPSVAVRRLGAADGLQKLGSGAA